ncbi:MAG: LacI family DNA-binding transcriptional regulator [Oscillospiraceae bacterium]|nr:LacI family DNA-binding transcriptional regulator [Oscillospiraceae bacterium]
MNVIKLAEITGVSKSTIYRALNGDKIKESTRQKIIDTINENDINFSFTGFGNDCDSRVKLIGLVISSAYRDRSATEMMKDRFSENGFTVIEIAAEAVENGSHEIKKYISKNFRSFIFMGNGLDTKCSEFITLAASSRPVILIHSQMNGKNIHCISSDEKDAVSKAIVKLADDYGHKNFLYCISDKTEYGKNISCVFENGIKLSGLGRNNFCSADCTAHLSPVDAILSALKRNPSITAIITQDEKTAVSAVDAAERLGLKIPRDITIVGIKTSGEITDSHSEIAYIDTKISTLSDMALTLTIAAINGKRAVHHVNIPCSFIQKKTVARSSIPYSKAM